MEKQPNRGTPPYLSDGRTHEVKVLLCLGVETEGAAGVHAAEGHLPGVLTMERLERTGEDRAQRRCE